MNPLNLHTEGVSNAARQHRHLERSRMPLWETDGKCSHDTLSREISHRNAARTIRGGDFSTPLRFGRNDGRGAGRLFYNLRPKGTALPPLWCFTAPPSPRGAVGLWMLSHEAMSLQESIERFILSPGWGGKGTRFVREQSDLRIV